MEEIHKMKLWAKNLIMFISLFLVSAPVSAQMRFEQDSRIAIIGAGASGLTAAFHLMEKGYENITVYEKLDRVGGKVYSYDYNGYTFEIGAFWATKNYDTIFEMADAYGIEAIEESANMIVRQPNGQDVSFEDNLFKNYNVFQIGWAALNFQWASAKFGDDVKKAGFDNIHPDLYMPMKDFAKKYRIEPFALAYRPFWIGCGYGYFETTPAIFVLKLMMTTVEEALSGAVKNILPFGGGNEAYGLRRFVGGYQSVFEAVAANVPDLRLSSEVTSVKRIIADDGDLEIHITANGKTDVFDKVIISADLRAAKKFLDVDEEEAELFSKVKSYNFYIYLVEADGVNYPPNSLVFMDENGTANTIGKMVAFLNREAVPGVWTTGQLIPDGTPSGEIVTWLSEDLAYIGGSLRNIILEQAWNYFPYVDEDALNDGFYERLTDLQGDLGTYYVGGIMNFETVEATARFAKHLVETRF